MEPADRTAFLAGLSKVLTLPSRARAPIDAAALDATWWGELLDLPWVTAPVWERAVSEAVRTCDFRPGFSEMLGICEVAVTLLEQEAWRASAPALPPPTEEPPPKAARRRSGSGGPGRTPTSAATWRACSRRWEEEARLDDWTPHPTKPGVWIRTAPEDLARLRVSRASDEALARVPEMTVEQRRARDRRIEGIKARARDAVRGFLRHHPRRHHRRPRPPQLPGGPMTATLAPPTHRPHPLPAHPAGRAAGPLGGAAVAHHPAGAVPRLAAGPPRPRRAGRLRPGHRGRLPRPRLPAGAASRRPRDGPAVAGPAAGAAAGRALPAPRRGTGRPAAWCAPPPTSCAW